MKRLENDVFPIIGKTPIKELTPKMLLDMAKSIQERGANELAKRVIQMSKHIFQYAIVTGRAERNIAVDLKGLIKSKPKKHFASLDLKELPEFFGSLYSNEARLMPLTHLAVQFMMLTFVRTSEMIKAEWDEFDFEERVWLIAFTAMILGLGMIFIGFIPMLPALLALPILFFALGLSVHDGVLLATGYVLLFIFACFLPSILK